MQIWYSLQIKIYHFWGKKKNYLQFPVRSESLLISLWSSFGIGWAFWKFWRKHYSFTEECKMVRYKSPFFSKCKWWRAILDIDDLEIFNNTGCHIDISEFISENKKKIHLLSAHFVGLFETAYGLPNFLNTQQYTVRQMLISS